MPVHPALRFRSAIASASVCLGTSTENGQSDMRKCRVNGCNNWAKGFSRLCAKHKARKRRHGDPDQPTITKTDLKPFVAKVQTHITKNPASTVWHVCDKRWDAMVQVAESCRAETYFRHERQAAMEILRLNSAVRGRDIAITTVAMYLLQYERPHLFRSERAFRSQLVRRVRTLNPSNFQTTVGAADGRERRVLNELPPKAVTVLAAWLVELFGPVGVKLAQAEQREAEEKRKAQAELAAAMREIS